jgi:DNA-binding MarR family transcriptional regulator
MPLRAGNPPAVGESLDTDAAALYDALSDLIRVYQFRDRDRVCCHDISITQWYALDSLARRGPYMLNELAGELFLDKSTVSRVVDALERKRLLRRARQAGDRRAVSLSLTPHGRQLYRRIRRSIEEQEKQLIADFAPPVRVALVDLLGRLAGAAARCVDTTGGVCCVVE